MARILTVWVLTRALLLLCVFHVLTAPGPDVTSDVSVIYQAGTRSCAPAPSRSTTSPGSTRPPPP